MLSKVLFPVVQTYAKASQYEPVISPMATKSSVNLTSDSSQQNFKFNELSLGFRDGKEYKEEGGILFDGNDQKPSLAKKYEVPNYFYLSIPKLKIKNAKIKTNSTDLDPQEALGHYNGSCLPTEGCNTFIFGHSTYKSAKNNYEEGDYTEIFSKLDELEYGDEFSITFNGKEYRYLVDLTKIQRPENVNPLENPLPKSLGRHENTVELFTCSPPGTTKFRLSVVGRLVD